MPQSNLPQDNPPTYSPPANIMPEQYARILLVSLLTQSVASFVFFYITLYIHLRISSVTIALCCAPWAASWIGLAVARRLVIPNWPAQFFLLTAEFFQLMSHAMLIWMSDHPRYWAAIFAALVLEAGCVNVLWTAAKVILGTSNQGRHHGLAVFLFVTLFLERDPKKQEHFFFHAVISIMGAMQLLRLIANFHNATSAVSVVAKDVSAAGVELQNLQPRGHENPVVAAPSIAELDGAQGDEPQEEPVAGEEGHEIRPVASPEVPMPSQASPQTPTETSPEASPQEALQASPRASQAAQTT
ncbi:hypothetical protein G7046_g4525 [Stylonectria norvegica]|nr:hypothetical protein G7046_g4525 [Stylonectria norvegica]